MSLILRGSGKASTGSTPGFLANGASRGVIGPLTAALLLLVLALAAVSFGLATFEAERGRTTRINAAKDQTDVLLSDLRDAETGQRGFLLTGRESYLQPYDDALRELDGRIAELIRLGEAEPTLARPTTELGRLIPAKLDELARTIALRREGNADAALALVETDRGKSLMDAIRTEAGALRAAVTSLHEGRNAATQRWVWSISAAALVLVSGVLALAVWLRHFRRRALDARVLAEMANARLAAIVTSTSDAIISIAADDGRILTWNSGAEALFGYAASEVTDRSVSLLVPLDVPDGGSTGVIRLALEGTRVHEHETVWLTKQGHRIPVTVTAARMQASDSGVIGVSAIIRDLRPRQEAQAALVRSEAMLRIALDTIPQMVWSTHPDGYHDFYNKRWYEFTGATPEQTEGEGWNPQFHPEDQGRALDRWRHSLATGEPYEVEYRLRAADGTYRWTLGRALPVRDPVTREVTRWYGTCTEIDDLVATRLALGEALEVKEALLAEVNHRVKNSLQLVSSLLSLQTNKARDPDLRTALGEARARIGVVARLHQRLYQGGTHGSVDLASFLREMCTDTLAALDPEERVRLDFDEARPDESGDGRLTSIDQAVPLALIGSELVTNAVKYAFPDSGEGVLRVRVRNAHAGEGGLALEVEDDGIGLPESFDPSRSAGVGMRVVSTLARQLRARLVVGRGSSGRGASFSVIVPGRQVQEGGKNGEH
ncbi:PAS domain S-box protein [Roseomonas nepalensis]|uniref:histidine kinase n=1 Tax=Muricoccus nepalensis TaxID=1854500 RepID=A0A502FIP5_9PROT|nr:CHASE3 domain-containing protein [Roseomonas nepalensis]TPG49315.1 PAS domain S-box protein [Roseomonas nepalensis]